MTRLRGTMIAAAVPLFLISACAANDPAGAATSSSTPAAGLAVRVESFGGFVPAEHNLGPIPAVSLYADGRLITQGSTTMIYPPRALPNILEQMVTPEFVQDLVRQGTDAGVRNGADFGTPNIADAPSTRITVGDQSVTIMALGEAQPTDPRLTEAQRTARSRLSAYVKKLESLSTDEGVAQATPYQPTTLVALARSYVAPQASDPPAAPIAWPGPALPGDTMNANLGIGCVASSGAEKDKVLAAAAKATAITPWTSGGAKWSVTFRPLLPDEQGCAALKGTK